MADKIEGRNPVLEALNSGKQINKILVSKGNRKGPINKIINMARNLGIPVVEVANQKLDSISESHNHQGVIAFVPPYNYIELKDILNRAFSSNRTPLLIVLDKVKDPHNLGSIIRTAEVAGAHGVIIPKRRSAGITTTVVKTSAGAVEYLPVARVSNIVQTLEILKKEGFWIVGADMSGEPVYRVNLKGPMTLVIGSEGEGLSRLVKEKCDYLASLPVKGKISSLNAAVAAAIMIYETIRQNYYSGKD
ncbi:MAG: rRNA (guanosine2251-2-O)-methyltransferase [Thermosediminibacterales bacterium]|nr:rRNA (guanosine2251-2-O)-methyltransferase [Thermosediminibacterales bacterium]